MRTGKNHPVMTGFVEKEHPSVLEGRKSNETLPAGGCNWTIDLQCYDAPVTTDLNECSVEVISEEQAFPQCKENFGPK